MNYFENLVNKEDRVISHYVESRGLNDFNLTIQFHRTGDIHHFYAKKFDMSFCINFAFILHLIGD